jgi:ubiquinone/menaquinone biosynthesis C-methylase UbiE
MTKDQPQKDWNEFARIDAKWSILTYPAKKFNLWEDSDFLKSGEDEVKSFIKLLNDYHIHFVGKVALDFGCGIGRVTQAFSSFFDEVFGVDLSQEMVDQAKAINKKNNVIYIQNSSSRLDMFHDHQLDLIFSILTLQHISRKELIIDYLKEFKRILKPNGIIYFQLPTINQFSLVKRCFMSVRACGYYILTGIGMSPIWCYQKFKLYPRMSMNYLESATIQSIFKGYGMHIFNDQSLETTYLIIKPTTDEL